MKLKLIFVLSMASVLWVTGCAPRKSDGQGQGNGQAQGASQAQSGQQASEQAVVAEIAQVVGDGNLNAAAIAEQEALERMIILGQ